MRRDREIVLAVALLTAIGLLLIFSKKSPKPTVPKITPALRVWVEGPCSSFGGPDNGRAAGNTWSHIPSEGLALWSGYESDVLEARGLLLPRQSGGSTGLARRLDPSQFYVACRWPGWFGVDRARIRRRIRNTRVRVEAPGTGWNALAWPVDYGPHISTGREVDCSPGLLAALGIVTNDTVRLYLPVDLVAHEPEPTP